MSYDDKFFKRHYEKYRLWEVAIGAYLADRLRLTSAIDFGCGIGSYLEGMQTRKVRVLGIELSLDKAMPYVVPSLKNHLISANIALPLTALGVFDAALSIEVAEHLDPIPEQIDGYLDNLTSHAFKYVIFTAAPPGQGGTHHVNCQPKEYWIDKIQQRRCVYSHALTVEIAAMCQELKAAKWIVRNMMVFTRY